MSYGQNASSCDPLKLALRPGMLTVYNLCFLLIDHNVLVLYAALNLIFAILKTEIVFNQSILE